MRKYIRIQIFVFILFFGIPELSIYSQNTNSENQQNQTASNLSPSDAQRIANLETKLEAAEKYNDKILNTVNLALGILAAVLILVVGLGWYTNFRIYKSDVEGIRREFTDEFDKAKTSFKNEMVTAAREVGEKEVRKSVRDIKQLQYNVLLQEAKSDEQKKEFTHALLLYSNAIEVSLEIMPDIYIPQILETMLAILKKNEFGMPSIIAAEIIKNLESVPKEFDMDVANIKELISDLRKKSSNSNRL